METHLCKLCVILRSRVLRVVCPQAVVLCKNNLTYGVSCTDTSTSGVNQFLGVKYPDGHCKGTFVCQVLTRLLTAAGSKWTVRLCLGLTERSFTYVRMVKYIIKIKIHSSCEIEDFVETHLCKLCVILRSRALRVVCPH